MRNDEIEILEDFSDNMTPNNNSTVPNLNQGLNSNNEINRAVSQSPNQDLNFVEEFTTSSAPTLGPASVSQPSESVNEFEKMVNEAPRVETEVSSGLNQNSQESSNNLYFQSPNMNASQNPANSPSYDNGFVADEYAADVNNDLVQSNSNNEDLTITAVYPNGLVVDQKEELENTQVIKPKKKGNGDLPLIIIVAVLAITLIVLLIVFYL